MQPTLTAMSAMLALALGAEQALEAQPSNIHPTDVVRSRDELSRKARFSNLRAEEPLLCYPATPANSARARCPRSSHRQS